MDIFVNIITILLIATAGVATWYIYVRGRKKTIQDYMNETTEKEREVNEQYLLEYIKKEVNEHTTSNLYAFNLTEKEFLKESKKRERLKNALKICMFGDYTSKEYVKDFIYSLLQKKLDDLLVDQVIPFHRTNALGSADKFDIILYIYKEKRGYKNKALKAMITDFELDSIKHVIEGGKVGSYIITKEEVDFVYEHVMGSIHLTYQDKLKIITQRIYQRYKGLGVIDEIRDMDIDGVSGGVSGKIDALNISKSMSKLKANIEKVTQSTESVWIMLSGKTMHLSFLSFNSMEELKRICRNIYRFNSPGQLSESNGYKVNDLADGSRVVTVRPPFSESWAFFVRKFDTEGAILSELIKDENCEVVIKLIELLNASEMVTAITGAQGSGKTTLLMAMIASIDPTLTLRIQEMAFETHLRNIHPDRNILTFRETDTISGQQGLDLQKKTDGSVNIIGEVASDAVAAWMIQAAQVASRFTIFTHHAKTIGDLVLSLRNSLLKEQVFRDESVASEQVASVLNFNIHLVKDKYGKRYIQRITEIREADKLDSLPRTYTDIPDSNERMTAFMNTMTEYFDRRLNRETYFSNDIIRYQDGAYKVVNPISDKTLEKMSVSIDDASMPTFKNFISLMNGQIQQGA